MKKLLALLLCTILIASAICGCDQKPADNGDPTATDAPETTDPRVEAYEAAVAKINAAPIDFKSAILTPDILEAIENETFTEPKNVIFMIGDGMGFEALNAGEAFYQSSLLDGKLAMRRLPVQAEQMTYSADANITDSAAGGTALAVGYKTANSVVGKNKDKSADYKSNLERAAEKGMSTGVITTDLLTGATPADFTVHVDDRGLAAEIAAAQLERMADGTIDLLLGGGAENFNSADNAAALKKATDAGVTVAEKWTDVTAASLPVAGLLCVGEPDTSSVSMPSLAEQVDFALTKLSENENGFFLMVEGGQIDHFGHSNTFDREAGEVLFFDQAVAVAMRFAALHPDTLVIVTADHETGGLRTPHDLTPENAAESSYSTSGHSGFTVPCLALGLGTEALDKINENVDLGRFVANILGDTSLEDLTKTVPLFNDTFDYTADFAPVNPDQTEANTLSSTDSTVTATIGARGNKFYVPVDKLTSEGPIRAVRLTLKNVSDHYADVPQLTFEAEGSNNTVRPSAYYVEPGETVTLTYFVPSVLWDDISALNRLCFKIYGRGSLTTDVTYEFSDFTAVIRPLDR